MTDLPAGTQNSSASRSQGHVELVGTCPGDRCPASPRGLGGCSSTFSGCSRRTVCSFIVGRRKAPFPGFWLHALKLWFLPSQPPLGLGQGCLCLAPPFLPPAFWNQKLTPVPGDLGGGVQCPCGSSPLHDLVRGLTWDDSIRSLRLGSHPPAPPPETPGSPAHRPLPVSPEPSGFHFFALRLFLSSLSLFTLWLWFFLSVSVVRLSHLVI